MSVAYVSTTLDHDVEAVWAVVGDFHGLPAWIGRILSGEAEGGDGRGPVGSVRRLTLAPAGRPARERLVHYDDSGRSYSYEFADAIPFPVHAYRGTVRVRPITDSGSTFIEWYGEFACDAAVLDEITATFEAIYTEFLGDLRAHLEG